MDASAVELNVLEQGGHIIAYASQTLIIKSESNWSVTQKKCLAIIFDMKQLYHYYTLMTDHAPL